MWHARREEREAAGEGAKRFGQLPRTSRGCGRASARRHISGRRVPGVCLHVSLDEYFILLPSRAPQPTALSLRLYTFSCLPPCFPFVPRRCAAYCCFLFSFFSSLSAVLRATQSCVSLKFLLRTNEFTQLAQETYRLTVGVKNGYFHFTSHVQHPASQLALDCE